LEIAKIERQAKASFAKQSTSRAEGAPYKPPFTSFFLTSETLVFCPT
jgi:hypothetical protein